MIYLRRLTILILAFSVFACSRERSDLRPEDEIDVPTQDSNDSGDSDSTEVPDAKGDIKLSKSAINGESFLKFSDDFQIETESTWEISGSEDWIELSKVSGSGNTTIDITVDKNASFDSRSVILKVSTDDGEAGIKIEQPGIDLSKAMMVLQEGKYINFPEENSIMKVPSDPAFNFSKGQSFSISLKIRTNVAPEKTDSRVIARRDGFKAGFEMLLKSTKGNPTTGTMLFSANDGDGNTGSFWGQTSVTDGKWHHVVGVYDVEHNKALIYIDGNLESNQNRDIMGAIENDDAPLYFGAKDGGFGFPYIGDLDDVRFWEKALTVEEIYADGANVLLDSDKDALVASWSFENADENGVHADKGQFIGSLENGAVIK